MHVQVEIAEIVHEGPIWAIKAHAFGLSSRRGHLRYWRSDQGAVEVLLLLLLELELVMMIFLRGRRADHLATVALAPSFGIQLLAPLQGLLISALSGKLLRQGCLLGLHGSWRSLVNVHAAIVMAALRV